MKKEETGILRREVERGKETMPKKDLVFLIFKK